MLPLVWLWVRGYTSTKTAATTQLDAALPAAAAIPCNVGGRSDDDQADDEGVASFAIHETLHPSCNGVIDVRWINLASSPDRRQHMATMLDRILSTNELAMQMVRSSERFDAVHASCGCSTCQRAACVVDGACRLSNESITLLERDTQQTPNTRAGRVGSWCSHYSALYDFVHNPQAAPLLLLLEDDAQLDAAFFAVLPSWLAELPVDGWDVVRFSTWSHYRESDRINPASLTSRIYHARHVEAEGQWSLPSAPLFEYYMGIHVSLVTKAGAESLLLNLMSCGIVADGQCGYHETTPTQVTPSGRDFRSYAIPTPLAGWIDLPSTIAADDQEPTPFDSDFEAAKSSTR